MPSEALWITLGFVHRVSTGITDFSTISSTGQSCARRGPKALFHSFHSPYYYYYYLLKLIEQIKDRESEQRGEA
jgi:hypothetical protein